MLTEDLKIELGALREAVETLKAEVSTLRSEVASLKEIKGAAGLLLTFVVGLLGAGAAIAEIFHYFFPHKS